VRYVLWIIWAIVLAAIAYAARPEAPEPGRGVVAARDLPKYRRLRPGDVVFGGERAYLTAPVKHREPIDGANIVGWPRIEPVPNTLAIAFSVSGSADEVNAGDRAQLCPAPEAGALQVTVSAVLCDDGGRECVAIAAVPPNMAVQLAAQQRNGRATSLARNCS